MKVPLLWKSHNHVRPQLSTNTVAKYQGSIEKNQDRFQNSLDSIFHPLEQDMKGENNVTTTQNSWKSRLGASQLGFDPRQNQ